MLLRRHVRGVLSKWAAAASCLVLGLGVAVIIEATGLCRFMCWLDYFLNVCKQGLPLLCVFLSLSPI